MDEEDLDVRLSVLETKHGSMHESLGELKVSVKEVSDVVCDLRDRANKTNGMLPYIKESVDKFGNRLDSIEIAVNNNKSVAIKVKILWGILASIGVILLSALVKFLLD